MDEIKMDDQPLDDYDRAFNEWAKEVDRGAWSLDLLLRKAFFDGAVYGTQLAMQVYNEEVAKTRRDRNGG